MMADLMFRKNEYDSATFHFQQLLERKPGIVRYFTPVPSIPYCKEAVDNRTAYGDYNVCIN